MRYLKSKQDSAPEGEINTCRGEISQYCADAGNDTIGYQTNLIVQGVGGYRFTDFVKVGLPMNLIVFILSVFLIPLVYGL